MGVLLASTVVFGVAAFKPYGYIAARTFSVGSVACSADAKTVYLTDLTGVQKSTDGGNSWTKIITAEEAKKL